MKRHRYTDGAGRVVEAGKQMGIAGGEGVVYETRGNSAVVMKIYHELPDSSTIEKLELMIANPPREVSTQGPTTSLAWPQQLLYDSSRKVVGFTMPFVEAWDAGRVCDKRQRPKLRTSSSRQFDWRDLHTIARNVAMIVSACHHAGYVIGDINHNNVRVRRDGTVVVIDTDSFQVPTSNRSSAKVHHCTKTFTGYTPPELIGKDLRKPHKRDPSADLFSLAVLIFELLQDRAGPFQGMRSKGSKRVGDAIDVETAIALNKYPYNYERPANDYLPPTGVPVFGRLHPDIRRLFQQTFAKGLTQPTLRPDAAAWISVLDTARGSILECRQGHLYCGDGGGVCLEKSVDQTSVCGSTAFSRSPQPVPISKVNIFDGSIAGITPPGPTRIGFPGTTSTRVGNVTTRAVPRNTKKSAAGRVIVQPAASPSHTATPSATSVAKESKLFRNLIVFALLIVIMLIAREELADLSPSSDQEALAMPTVQTTKQPVSTKVALTVPPAPTADSSSSIASAPDDDGETPVADTSTSRIVYSWNDGEVWHISMLEPDHGTTHELVTGLSADPVPIFTPSGSKLLFVDHSRDGGNTLIHSFELGSNQIIGTTSLSAPLLVNRMSLMRDGTGLLLSVNGDSGPRILQFNFVGSELLPFLPVSSLDFAIAPTGRTAYVVYENSEPKIVLADEQGNASVYMAPGLYCQRLPVFSSNGSNMAFLYGTCEGRARRIAVWNGRSIVTLNTPDLRQWDPSVSIAWSPFQYVLAVAGCEGGTCLITFVSIHGDSTVGSLTWNFDDSVVRIGSIDWSPVTVEGSE